MIISVTGEYTQDDYVVCPRAPASLVELRERMLRRAGVTAGSYAYRLIDDLHAAVFIRSLDLKADFEEYFASEYGSFAEYLRHRLRFPTAVVTRLTDALEVSSGEYHFRAWHAFLEGRYGLDFLKRLVDDRSAEDLP